jgi:hypothetical protein
MTTNSPCTIQTLAAEMSEAFETPVRPTNGEKFRKLKDNAPTWMTTVCRKAHDDGNILADDWRYVLIEQAVDALAAYDDADDARSSLEPDIYISDLTAWLDSLSSRVEYLSEALTEYGSFRDGWRLLAAAQMIEKEEVFQQVLEALAEVKGNDV